MTAANVKSLVAGARVHAKSQPVERPSRSFDAAELLGMPMADPNYVLRPFVPEGVTLFCGRPKLGKTTALRQLAYAVNTGGTFMGEQCNKAEVWFLSLEEGERLFRKKLSAMALPADGWRGVRIEFEWPQGHAGAKALRERLRERASTDPLLIVIDSLQRFRAPQNGRGHAFTEDYEAMQGLAELCKEFPGLAVVVLHHVVKAIPDDPVAAISGTNGLVAAADGYCIMLKQGTQYRLHAGGRLWDRDDSDFELKREGGQWHMVGTWSDHSYAEKLPPLQRQILAALKTGAKTNKTLAEDTGQSASALSHMLRAMESRGLVVRVANGWGIA